MALCSVGSCLPPVYDCLEGRYQAHHSSRHVRNAPTTRVFYIISETGGLFWAVTCDSNLCVSTWESRESPRAPLFEDIGLRSFLCRLTIEKLIRLKISIWTIHDCLRCAGVMATNFKFHFELVRNHYALLSTGSSHVNQSMSCASEQLCFEIYHCFIA